MKNYPTLAMQVNYQLSYQLSYQCDHDKMLRVSRIIIASTPEIGSNSKTLILRYCLGNVIASHHQPIQLSGSVFGKY